MTIELPVRPPRSLRPSRARSHGFSFPELMVVLAIIVILLIIFIPYALSRREAAHRTICADNLRSIFGALQSYQRANDSFLPRVVNDVDGSGPAWTAFTGPDDANPYAANSAVKPNDVTAALWLLVRQGYITDTKVFVCPSAGGDVDTIVNVSGAKEGAARRGNFRARSNLSYSFCSPYSPDARYRLTDTLKGGFVLMADMNPGVQAGPNPVRVDFQATAMAYRKVNSRNHGGAGQHVLYSEGTVKFWFTPYCAIDNDNIYTSQSNHRPTSQPTTAPSTTAPALDPHAPGYLGTDIYPANDRDSYLVPTAK